MKRLRSAQVAPVNESLPSKVDGATSRVISYLTEELVQRRHYVTLFASGDSIIQWAEQVISLEVWLGMLLNLHPCV
jgi:hypothetical protein